MKKYLHWIAVGLLVVAIIIGYGVVLIVLFPAWWIDSCRFEKLSEKEKLERLDAGWLLVRILT